MPSGKLSGYGRGRAVWLGLLLIGCVGTGLAQDTDTTDRLAKLPAEAPPGDSVSTKTPAAAEADGEMEELGLSSFRDNYVGYTLDDDDEPFLDFTVSVRYPVNFLDKMLFLNQLVGCLGRKTVSNQAYFAFSGRFGQYVVTRESSPVIGKQFNPFLYEHLQRSFGSWECLARIGYGHESNGQEVDDTATYYAFQRNYIRKEKSARKADFVKDLVSRGWDYIGIDIAATNQGRWEMGAIIKAFLSNGILQGPKEDYKEWEDKSGITSSQRSHVNGARFYASYRVPKEGVWLGLSAPFLRLSYETGIYKPFAQGNSIRTDAGLRIYSLPVILWYAKGHLSDLAQFGKEVSSYGFALELNSFSTPFF